MKEVRKEDKDDCRFHWMAKANGKMYRVTSSTYDSPSRRILVQREFESNIEKVKNKI